MAEVLSFDFRPPVAPGGGWPPIVGGTGDETPSTRGTPAAAAGDTTAASDAVMDWTTAYLWGVD